MGLGGSVWVYTTFIAEASIGIDGMTFSGFSNSYGIETSPFEINIFGALAYSACQSS